MSLLLPLVAVLVPILTLPHILFYFDVTPKVAALLIGAAVACCFFRTNARSLIELSRTRDGKRLVILFAVLAVSLVISTGFSTNEALSLSGGNWRRFGLVTQLGVLVFVMLAVAQIATGRVKLGQTIRAMAASGLVISIYTLLQYFGWDPLLPSAAYHVGEGLWTIVRPPGTIGHANYLGTYLIFVVFLGGSLWSEQSRFWRLVALLTVVTGAVAIIVSGARSAIVGAIAGAVFLMIRIRPQWRTILPAALACVAALAVFYYSPSGQKLRSRTRWYREDPIGGARLLLWRDSLHMARERALTGWGPETFATEFPRFQSLELAQAYPDFYHESPHNVFLDELTGKGLLGFAVFAVITGLALWASNLSGQQAFGAAFIGALVSVQFNSFVLATALFFYLTAAILIAGRFDPKPADPTRRSYAAVATVGIVVAFIFVLFAVQLCIADHSLARVKRLIENHDPFAVSAAYGKVLAWQPRGVSSDLYYSRAMAPVVRSQREPLPAVKAWQEAIQAGLRATQNAEDRHNAFYNLASLYALINNSRDAEQSLRRAIEVAPNWYKPHWMLAQVLHLSGKRAEALREAETALSLGGSKHTEVVETLRAMKP